MTLTAVPSELSRILALPILGEITDEWAEEVTAKRCPPGAIIPGGLFQGLNKEQALALEGFATYGAGFVLSGVGTGKTTIAYGCAQIAINELGHERVLILLPNNTARQFTSQGRREAQSWLGFKSPVHNMHGMSKALRTSLVKLARPGVYVMPYSLLSVQDTEEVLRGIGATCIICDEAHRLRNVRSAGARRLFRYAGKLDPATRAVVLLSGTMTRSGLKDFQHLAAFALGTMSPLPITYKEAERWGNAIDARGSSFNPLIFGGIGVGSVLDELRPMISWAREVDPLVDLGKDPFTQVRRAFGLRLTQSHGVVSSPEGSMPCSLSIDLVPTAVPNETTQQILYNIQHLGVKPDGDIIEFGLHRYKWMLESAAGFHNDLQWPELESLPGRTEAHLQRSMDHHNALQTYHKELRLYLDGNPKELLDTPWLVGQHFYREKSQGSLGTTLYRLWRDAKDLAAFPELVKRVSNPIRVDLYKIKAMLAWAKTLGAKDSALVWVHHNAMREWAVEALREAGYTVVDCPSGSKAADKALDVDQASKRPGTIYVLSYWGWKEGLNLQWSSKCFYLQWPCAEDVAEQSIGRQHRQGQMADEMQITVPMCPEFTLDGETIVFDHTLFCATLVKSLYVQQTSVTTRRLMAAAYPTAPRIYPTAMLAERFPDAMGLTRDVAEQLFKKFAG